MIDVEALDKIRAIASSYGAKLIVATKTRPAETVAELHRLAPEVIMGENRAQELLDKYDPACEWHMIGRLQTNKVKYLIGKVSLIHSLDRLELAAEIERQAAKRDMVQDVLVEVNMGAEESKGGVSPQHAEDLIKSLVGYEHLRVLGIMTVMPRVCGDELDALYADLKRLYDALRLSVRQSNADLKYLSAGMSEDYQTALAHGANMIRIGRAILGERPANTQDI